jgi:glutathione S-transferase
VKKFQAPLADPYAIPELSLENDMDVCLRYLVQSLILGYTGMPPLVFDTSADSSIREGLTISLKYLQARIGVPRDMDYPAARQLRAYLGYLIGQLTA